MSSFVLSVSSMEARLLNLMFFYRQIQPLTNLQLETISKLISSEMKQRKNYSVISPRNLPVSVTQFSKSMVILSIWNFYFFILLYHTVKRLKFNLAQYTFCFDIILFSWEKIFRHYNNVNVFYVILYFVKWINSNNFFSFLKPQMFVCLVPTTAINREATVLWTTALLTISISVIVSLVMFPTLP